MIAVYKGYCRSGFPIFFTRGPHCYSSTFKARRAKNVLGGLRYGFDKLDPKYVFYTIFNLSLFNKFDKMPAKSLKNCNKNISGINF